MNEKQKLLFLFLTEIPRNTVYLLTNAYDSYLKQVEMKVKGFQPTIWKNFSYGRNVFRVEVQKMLKNNVFNKERGRWYLKLPDQLILAEDILAKVQNEPELVKWCQENDISLVAKK